YQKTFPGHFLCRFRNEITDLFPCRQELIAETRYVGCTWRLQVEKSPPVCKNSERTTKIVEKHYPAVGGRYRVLSSKFLVLS
ncbi:MAG: hypothetical protein ACYSYU_08185, partial [Planctomycetota bacterium]